MNSADKAVLNKALPRLLDLITVNTKFKAVLVAKEVLDDDVLDEIFRISDPDEMVFQILQKLKRSGRGDLEEFISALKYAGQANAAIALEAMKSDMLASGVTLPPSSGESSQSSSTALPSNRDDSESCFQEAPSSRKSNVPKGYNIGSRTTNRSEGRATALVNVPPSFHTAEGPDGSSLESLRAGLRECLPPSPYYTEIGDVVVVDRYVQRCAKFSRGLTSKIPGPFENPPVGKNAVNGDELVGINPGTAAKMSRLLGGCALSMLQRRSGGIAVVSQDGTISYMSVKVASMEAPNFLRDVWASPSAKLCDVIAASFGWFPSKLETPASRYSSKAGGLTRLPHHCVELSLDQTTMSLFEDRYPTCVIYATT